MYSFCDCINLTFVCSDEVTTFNFNMTKSGFINNRPFYLGNFDGETYILYFTGSAWVFSNNSDINTYIFVSIATNSNPCNLGGWFAQDLTNFNYCDGDFDSTPIIIDEIINEYPNCGLFSGECGCKTVEFGEGYSDCSIVFQTCEGIIVNLSLNRLNDLTFCSLGNPIFVNTIDGNQFCGNILNENSVTCSNYCSVETQCCLNFTAITESDNFIDTVTPSGIINGKPFYIIIIDNESFTIFHNGDIVKPVWLLYSNNETFNFLESNDNCPVGEWEIQEPYFTFFTEQTDCPNPPIPPCLTGQTVNECDVLTILPLGAECQITNPTYTTESDGSITLVITGGTPPYQIFWDFKGVGDTIDNLSVGTYTATIVDYYGDFSATTTCVLTAEQPPIPCKNPIIQILDNIKDDVGLNTDEGLTALEDILNSQIPTQVNNCNKVGDCSPNCQPYMLMSVENAGQVISTFESFCYKFNCCVTLLGNYDTYIDWVKFVDYPIFDETTFQKQCTPPIPYCEGAEIVEETNCDDFSDIQDCLTDLGTILPDGTVDDILNLGIFESGLYNNSSLLCLLKEYFEQNLVTENYVSGYIDLLLEYGLVIVYGTEPEDECIATVFGVNQYLTTIGNVSVYCELCVCYTPNGFLSDSQKYDLLNYEINGKPAWSSQTTNTKISWNNITNVWEITPAFYYLGTPTGQIINPTTINNAPNGATWQILSGPPLSLIATTYQTSGGYIQSCSSLCAKVLAIRPA